MMVGPVAVTAQTAELLGCGARRRQPVRDQHATSAVVLSEEVLEGPHETGPPRLPPMPRL
jgi:hypothetical protein